LRARALVLFLGLAVPVAFAARTPVAPPARAGNVIVYMVDTLRADHLGCYGYGKPTSPRIDAFARESTLFLNAAAQSPWTRPSTASLLTGLWPRSHGVNGRKDTLSPEALTLAEMLKSRGYRTGAFVTNGNVAKSLGLGQGFDTYELLPRRRGTAADVTAQAAEWIAGGSAPFFLFLHTVEPHAPYVPESPFRERFAPGVPDIHGRLRTVHGLGRGQIPVTPKLIADLTALYDAEIAANDAAFGALLAHLETRGLRDSTAVVFVSDHGEEFFDHGGWEHGKTLHTEMLDVPLIIRLPGMGEGRTVARQAQHIDVVPTLLAWLGMPVPNLIQGRSLLPWIQGRHAPVSPEDNTAFSWLDVDGVRAGAVSTPDWRLIDRRGPSSGVALYDRWADPGERSGISTGAGANTPARLAARFLWSLLRRRELEGGPALKAGEGVLDDEVIDQLRALGYIQ
jgi:arylsulfatase A-like enzyme